MPGRMAPMATPRILGAVASGRRARERQEGGTPVAPSGLARGESSPLGYHHPQSPKTGVQPLIWWTGISARTAPISLWVADIERHEALLHRAVVKDHRLQSVAAG